MISLNMIWLLLVDVETNAAKRLISICLRWCGQNFRCSIIEDRALHRNTNQPAYYWIFVRNKNDYFGSNDHSSHGLWSNSQRNISRTRMTWPNRTSISISISWILWLLRNYHNFVKLICSLIIRLWLQINLCMPLW